MEPKYRLIYTHYTCFFGGKGLIHNYHSKFFWIRRSETFKERKTLEHVMNTMKRKPHVFKDLKVIEL